MAKEFEPNNTISQSDNLKENEWTYGSVGLNLDLDSFKISLDSNSLLEISFDSPQVNDGTPSKGIWNIVIVNSSGSVMAKALMDYDGKLTFPVVSGDYYVLIENVQPLANDGEYGIKYTKTSGTYFASYEYDDSNASSNNMVEDIYHTGNLWGTNDVDRFKINLGDSNSEITISFDSPQTEGSYINRPGEDNYFNETYQWKVVLFNSSGQVLGGKIFNYDGSFVVNTKSTGTGYIAVYNDESGSFAPNNYSIKYTSNSTSSSSSSSNSSSSSSSSNSSSYSGYDYISTNSDTSLTATNEANNADDIYNSNQPRAKDLWLPVVDSDYSKLDSLTSDARISIDLDNNVTTRSAKFIPQVSYIIQVEYDEYGGVILASFAKDKFIRHFDPSKDTLIFQSMNDPDFKSNFSKESFINATNLDISVSSFDEETTIYFSPDSTGESGILKLGGVVDQDLSSIDIVFEDLQSSTFAVTASGSSTSTKITNQKSSEVEPNDQEDDADPLDPNWTNGIDDQNTLTSSHFGKDNIMVGNLSTNGDYDRYWVYMDANERIQLYFKPPKESSYEILFLNEATGELVEEWITNDTISIREGEKGNTTYSLYFTAPIKKVYQVVIRATDEGVFSSSDYELSIANFQNPSTSIYTSLSGIDSPDPGQDQIGTSVSETLRGTSKGEWLKGNGGNDIIYGNGGYDVIWGGEGDDKIYAGSGRNTIYVEKGNDFIYGGEAIDTLIIPEGWDVLRGVDTFGKWFSVGEEFIFFQSPDKTSTTYANSIEMMTILDSGKISSVNDFSYSNLVFTVYRNKFIEDLEVKDEKIEIDLSQYMASINLNETNQYTITSNTGPSENISITNNTLIINPSDKFDGLAEVTITTKNLGSNGSLSDGITDTFTINYQKENVIIKKYEVSENINSNYNVLSSYDDSTIINKNTLNYSPNDDIITLTNVGTARGLGGNDLYFVSNLITDNARIQIVDTDGINTIQIPKNTFIDEITFVKKAVKIELSDNIEVTINAADKFIFNLGGNISSGESGTNLTFDEFANLFDISLSDITSTEIINSDFYI